MALLSVSTPFNIDLEFSLASFGNRLAAWLIDIGIQYVYCFIMAFLLFPRAFSVELFDEDSQFFIVEKIFIILPVVLYPLALEIFNNGRTLGKMLMGLRVLTVEGAAPTLSQYALRWMINIPNFLVCTMLLFAVVQPAAMISILFFVGLTAIPAAISIGVSKYSQRLADLAAGTVVVNYKYRMPIEDTIYMDASDEEYQPKYPEVLRLSDRDINGIRNLLNNKTTKDTEAFMLKIAFRIEEVLGIKMEGHPRHFLSVLLKDYNYMTQEK